MNPKGRDTEWDPGQVNSGRTEVKSRHQRAWQSRGKEENRVEQVSREEGRISSGLIGRLGEENTSMALLWLNLPAAEFWFCIVKRSQKNIRNKRYSSFLLSLFWAKHFLRCSFSENPRGFLTETSEVLWTDMHTRGLGRAGHLVSLALPKKRGGHSAGSGWGAKYLQQGTERAQILELHVPHHTFTPNYFSSTSMPNCHFQQLSSLTVRIHYQLLNHVQTIRHNFVDNYSQYFFKNGAVS